MRHRLLLAVALIAVLAGCGGMADDNGSPSVENETGDADTTPAPEPDLEIDSITFREEVKFNDTQQGQIRISNAGDVAGNSTLSVRLDDTVIMTESVDLQANQTATYSYESQRLRVTEGDYSVEANLDNDQEIALFQVDHPSIYGKTNVSLYVDSSQIDRNISSIIDNSTAFWEAHAERTAGYPIQYQRVNSIGAADQILRYESVAECGDHNITDYNGCADRPDGDVGQWTISGSVEQNLSDPYLQETTTHELGHMLGLTHDDPPGYVMEINLSTFTANTTRVAFETADGDAMDPTVKQEAAAALDYYAERNVRSKYGFRWQEVATPEEAHLVIRVDSEGCAPDREAGSCTREWYYGNQNTIMIDEIDDENVAYHVGYHLAAFLLDERPPELSPDAEYDERENWPES